MSPMADEGQRRWHMEDKNAEEVAYGWRADGGGGNPATSSRLTTLQKDAQIAIDSLGIW